MGAASGGSAGAGVAAGEIKARTNGGIQLAIIGLIVSLWCLQVWAAMALQSANRKAMDVFLTHLANADRWPGAFVGAPTAAARKVVSTVGIGVELPAAALDAPTETAGV